MKRQYLALSVLLSVLFSCSSFSENPNRKLTHFILGEWQSETRKEKDSKFFMNFQDNNTVKVLLKKGEETVEENVYAYKILDENNVRVDYIKPLEVKKIGDNFHFESSCNQPLIDPPILCFKDRFEKIK
ncbi:MAG TPA: hypothetical protein PKY82_25140 [Pyrinomonadaceae bacterium]|nr:hypothetical protein [Pyrinomonadaceae bacterium]